MTYSTVIIPLDHLDPNNRTAGIWRPMWRCYASENLQGTLDRIAGTGLSGLWWTEAEVINYLDRTKMGWAWTPTGDVDILRPDDGQSNRMTHMKIFFQDPNHALLFKLAWMPLDI